MDVTLFERLLYEEESPTLDFKKEQYRFVKASEEEKSELLKDILGFANAWRRSEAYILIGVEEVRGARSNVLGINATDHLDDHALQQFVNNLTNRPVRFHYAAFGCEGKQVGIFRIEEQQRPIYLKRDYGKLEKEKVYVRRGSSTDPTKPASLDEVAQMGRGSAPQVAELVVEFADVERDNSLGPRISWDAEFCKMPDSEDIPLLDDTPAPIRLPGGQTFQMPSVSSFDLHNRLNTHFYHELAGYEAIRRLVRKIRLVVANTGEVPATDVRLEIIIPNGQGVGIGDEAEIPDAPKRRTNVLAVPAMKNLKLRPAFRHAGYVGIDKNDHQTKIEIDCGNVQPGRKVWADTLCMGIGRSGEFKLTGHLYAANLPKPQEFTLSINASITETTMTVDELMSLDEPSDESDESDEGD
jgi:hypothetical protein